MLPARTVAARSCPARRCVLCRPKSPRQSSAQRRAANAQTCGPSRAPAIRAAQDETWPATFDLQVGVRSPAFRRREADLTQRRRDAKFRKGRAEERTTKRTESQTRTFVLVTKDRAFFAKLCVFAPLRQMWSFELDEAWGPAAPNGILYGFAEAIFKDPESRRLVPFRETRSSENTHDQIAAPLRALAVSYTPLTLPTIYPV